MTTPKKAEAASGRGTYSDMELLLDFVLIDKSIDWKEEAACKGMDTNQFLPEKGATQTVIEAKSVCTTCRVQQKCLDYALTNHIMQGVWCGKSPSQRKEYLRIRNRSNRL